MHYHCYVYRFITILSVYADKQCNYWDIDSLMIFEFELNKGSNILSFAQYDKLSAPLTIF